MFIARHGIVSSQQVVTTARTKDFLLVTGITDPLISTALSDMEADLLKYNLIDKLTALYPFVGGSEHTHRYNFIDINKYNIAFTSGVTHDLSGITGDGSNGYGDTGYNVETSSTDRNSVHISIYQRNNIAEQKTQIGASNNSGGCGLAIFTRYPNNESYGQTYNPSTLKLSPSSDSRGFFLSTRTTSNSSNFYRIHNDQKFTTSSKSNTSSTVSGNVYILGNGTNKLFNYSSANLSFATIGTGLNEDDVFNLSTIVQNFQTKLERQV